MAALAALVCATTVAELERHERDDRTAGQLAGGPSWLVFFPLK